MAKDEQHALGDFGFAFQLPILLTEKFKQNNK